MGERWALEDRPVICDYSWLRVDHCAHCLGHVIDPDLEEASKP